MQAGRGFWPGLSVALKHNSKFASFNLISKGNYPGEIQNPLPFSLIGNDDTEGGLLIIAGYWFQYNMYALARNAWKFAARDQRTDKDMLLEFDFLAPDTVSEILQAIKLLEKWVSESLGGDGKAWLNDPTNATNLVDIFATGIENTKRRTRIAKAHKAYQIFHDLLYYHAAKEWLATSERHPSQSPSALLQATSKNATAIQIWENLGGQLIPSGVIQTMKEDVKSGKITRWKQIHEFYEKQAALYPDQKFENALNGLLQINPNAFENIPAWIDRATTTSEFLTAGIERSRAKDYQDPYRLAMFGNAQELDAVIGDVKDNEFIQEAKAKQVVFRDKLKKLEKRV